MNKMSSTLSSFFNNLRLEGKLIDVEIYVDGVHFFAHKIVLCKCSPYFVALFTGGWHQKDKQNFIIPGVSADMMRLIIEYAYTDSVLVTKDNVEPLLAAADQFNVMGVVQACCGYLALHLNTDNCISIWNLTDIYFCPDLKHKAYQYILNHFQEVCVRKHFLELSLKQLMDIIEEDKLNVKQERTVFEAVMHWINHSPEERKAYISLLLSKIRLALLSKEYFTSHVKNNALVKNNKDCMAILTMYDIYTNGASISISGSSLTRPRLPCAILLAVGGWSGGGPTNVVEAYDVRANLWTDVTAEWEQPRAYPGIAFLDGSLYCIGGFNGADYYNSVRKFDLQSHTWSQAGFMKQCRCYVSVVVCDGRIYALGGHDGHQRLDTAERYDQKTNQWTLIASMHEVRSDASATALNGKVYICGGFNGTACLITAECYDPSTNQWTPLSPMTTARSGVGVIAYQDHVFAMGGYNGTDRLRTVEAYYPQTNTWQEVPSMLTPRSNFGIEVVDDAIFAIGGFNGSTTISRVERYDANINLWREVKDMELARSAMSCCVVYGLPNLNDYAADRF